MYGKKCEIEKNDNENKIVIIIIIYACLKP